ncbi:DUF6691 family protein [Roseovarius sp. SYSU LYC5161]|uniref:DUF6691 family protein n=1 Tax=Roseovarius halophilus (ex Wu et al. 2025) TaxID=3376060 RepID=UPI002871E22D|nr:YeeE/YedE family protein [Roseovarius sp.]
MRLVVTYLIGLIFGVGISISGMANPAKVLNFFDVAGAWDPSLIFVMGGALAVTFLGYRLVLARDRPIMSERFHLPASSAIDRRLVGGSALFGVGWGLSGFCPGGAIPALGTGRWEVALFLACVLAGVAIARGVQSRAATRSAA